MAKPVSFDIPDDTPKEVVDIAGEAIQVAVIALTRAQHEMAKHARNQAELDACIGQMFASMTAVTLAKVRDMTDAPVDAIANSIGADVQKLVADFGKARP